MTAYTGTREVEPGLYLHMRRFSITTVDKRGPLPGTTDDVYRRVPMLLMLAAAPLLGLVFVMFLPFIGFAVVLYLLGGKVAELATGVAHELGRVRRPGWAPALAFLSRSKPAKPAKTDDAAPEPVEIDTWANDVEKRLDETDHAGR